jgi:hypothetical protein
MRAGLDGFSPRPAPLLFFRVTLPSGWFACKRACVLNPPAMRLIFLVLCQGRRAQPWASQAEADFEEELK